MRDQGDFAAAGVTGDAVGASAAPHFGEPLWLLTASLIRREPGRVVRSLMGGYRIRATEAAARADFLAAVARSKPGFEVDDLLCMWVPSAELRHSLGLPPQAPVLADATEEAAPPTLLGTCRAVLAAWQTGRIQESEPSGDERALTGLWDVLCRLQGHDALDAGDNADLLAAARLVLAGLEARHIRAAAGAPQVALQALHRMVALHQMVIDDAPQWSGRRPG